MGVKKRVCKDAKMLLAIVERWREQGELTALERDLALSKLSSLYQEILLSDSSCSEKSEELDIECEVEPEVEVEVVLYDGDDELDQTESECDEETNDEDPDPEPEDGDEEPEVEVEVVLYEPEEEEVEDDEPEEEEVEDDEPEDDEVEDDEQPAADSVGFASKPRSARRSAILSLYEEEDEEDEQAEDESIEQSSSEEADSEDEEQEAERSEEVESEDESSEEAESEDEEQEAESAKQSDSGDIEIIAERLAERVELLSDRLSLGSAQEVVADRVSTLVKGVSVNDRYEIAHELFDGDVERLMELLAQLDEYTSFDECVIHISENHTFSSDGAAAQKLLELLKRRHA